MKLSIKPRNFQLAVTVAGAVGLLLRVWLYTSLDGQGLLQPRHIAGTLLSLLSLLVLAAVVILSRSISGPEAPEEAFGPSRIRCVGCLFLAVGILVTARIDRDTIPDPLLPVYLLLGGLAALVLVFSAFARYHGSVPSPVPEGLVCIYFAARIVSQYRFWSSNPQLHDYFFHLTACVCLMLTAYHHIAFPTGLSSHRKLWRISLISVYLCILSLYGHRDWLFYLCAGVWAFTNVTSLTSSPHRILPLPETEPEIQEE